MNKNTYESHTQAKLVIIGAGGHGREIFGALHAARVGCIGFLDDNPPDNAILARIGAPFLGSIDQYGNYANRTEFLIGIGSGAIREKIEKSMPSSHAAGPLIHPRAVLDLDVRIQAGAIVFANATVTTNIQIGQHTHIGRGAAVGHDSILGNFVTIMPLASISGSVIIGDRASIGTGAIIRQGQTIGADAMVGAGAVVVQDVPPNTVVVGNPARPITRTG